VDVGAIEFIHAQLVAERDRGRAILLVSAELSEILALSDRILVMYRGAVAAQFQREEASEALLGTYMMRGRHYHELGSTRGPTGARLGMAAAAALDAAPGRLATLGIRRCAASHFVSASTQRSCSPHG